MPSEWHSNDEGQCAAAFTIAREFSRLYGVHNLLHSTTLTSTKGRRSCSNCAGRLGWGQRADQSGRWWIQTRIGLIKKNKTKTHSGALSSAQTHTHTHTILILSVWRWSCRSTLWKWEVSAAFWSSVQGSSQKSLKKQDKQRLRCFVSAASSQRQKGGGQEGKRMTQTQSLSLCVVCVCGVGRHFSFNPPPHPAANLTQTCRPWNEQTRTTAGRGYINCTQRRDV